MSTAATVLFHALPVELWLLVAKLIEELGQANLSRLSRTSRANYTLWTPRLYTTITITSERSLQSLAKFARADTQIRTESQKLRRKRTWIQKLQGGPGPSMQHGPMPWRGCSPWHIVRNIRILLRRYSHVAYSVTGPAQAILNACTTSVVNICITSAFDSDMMQLFMQFPSRCRLVCEGYSGIFPFMARTFVHFPTSHIVLSGVRTFDDLQQISFERQYLPPTTHIVFGCCLETLDHPTNITRAIAKLLKYLKLQRIVLLVPILLTSRSGEVSMAQKITRLGLHLREVTSDPSLVVVRHEVWKLNPSDDEMNHRRWDELLRAEVDSFWEDGEPVIQLGKDEDTEHRAQSVYSNSKRISD
ncbi:hypothetical protein BKA62DRAFT_773231 [Auriculariales sp. MPI-PUGE-AT-0066]|nr:hypothetical protein BKA62DRAFT_773231 [Auriculariales sp. MPI-PUGE-AT-0066]